MVQPLGDLIDSLGVTHTPEDGELVAAVVVMLKTIDEEGRVGMRLAWSDGMSWIERLGMLRAAEHIELPGDDSE